MEHVKHCASALIEAIGPAAFRDHTGCSAESLRQYRARGIPAKFYQVIEDLCYARAIDCPREAFTFTQKESA